MTSLPGRSRSLSCDLLVIPRLRDDGGRDEELAQEQGQAGGEGGHHTGESAYVTVPGESDAAGVDVEHRLPQEDVALHSAPLAGSSALSPNLPYWAQIPAITTSGEAGKMLYVVPAGLAGNDHHICVLGCHRSRCSLSTISLPNECTILAVILHSSLPRKRPFIDLFQLPTCRPGPKRLTKA